MKRMQRQNWDLKIAKTFDTIFLRTLNTPQKELFVLDINSDIVYSVLKKKTNHYLNTVSPPFLNVSFKIWLKFSCVHFSIFVVTFWWSMFQ